MRRYLIHFVRLFVGTVILSFSFIVYAENNNPVVLTLRESILIALRYNPQVQSGEIQRVLDKFALRVAFWNYEPQYAINGAVGYSKTVSSGTLSESDSQNLTPTVSLLTPLGGTVTLAMPNNVSHAAGSARYYNPAATVGVTQPLLRGFGPDVALAPLHQAELTELSARLNLKNTIMSTVTAVISQYAAVAQAQNSLVAQQISVKNAIIVLNNQKGFLKAGRIAPADLVQYEANVSAQQLSLQQTEVTLVQQKRVLLILLGIDPNTPISTTKTIGFTNDTLLPLEEYIRLGLQFNIPYQQALLAVKNAQISLIVAKNQQLPVLNLTASHTQGGGSGGSPNSGLPSLVNGANSNTTLGLALNVPIDNLQLKQTLENAKVALRQQYILLAQAKRQVINDISTAYYTVVNQKQQMIQAKQAADLAQQTLFIAEAKLKYGRVTPFEVSTLQTNLITQQLAYINTISSYYTSLAALDQVVGTTLDRWNICLQY